jgi:hypothetical protein
LFCPARKLCGYHKFGKDFYCCAEIVWLELWNSGQERKEFVVHINRLKRSYDQTPWIFEDACHPRQKTKQQVTETHDENVEISRGLSPLETNANRRLSKRKPWRRNNCSLAKVPKCLEILKPQMQIAIGGGKRLIPLCKTQTINPQIPCSPEES